MATLLVVLSLLLAHAATGRATPRWTISPIKTIHREDGDVIDCVDIYNQPSLQHPLLKDHVIQMRPSSYTKGTERWARPTLESTLDPQVWLKSGGCPDGAIPIRRNRTSTDQTSIVSSPVFAKQYNPTNLSPKDIPHELAMFWPDKPADYGFFGAQAMINLWNPATEASVEFSSGRIGFMGASLAMFWPDKPADYGFFGAQAMINLWNPATEASVEFSSGRIGFMAHGDAGQETPFVGAQVCENLYGDSSTRLFVYWGVTDGTGCCNLNCPGFVQGNNTYALGGSIAPVSTYEGPQYILPVVVHKDFSTSDWWVNINGVDIGYWPAALFSSIKNYATHVEWGGEILNSSPGGHHTKTQMGSGHFPIDGGMKDDLGKVAYFANINYMNGDGVMKTPAREERLISNPFCYGYISWEKSLTSYDYMFFYGGPGGTDPSCE